MNFKSMYAMDKEAENRGRWVPWYDGAELLVARSNNDRAVALRKKLMAPYERPGFRNRKPTEKEQKAILIEVVAHACLLDWKGMDFTGLEAVFTNAGIEVNDPKSVPYSPEAGKALMEWSEDFLNDLLLVCSNEELYRAEQQEEDEGKP